MKKKILLRTLMPLATVGAALGTALPLVSCSCGNNDNEGIQIWNNEQEARNFIVPTANASVDPADANHNWSSNAIDYQPMLSWFNNNIDAQTCMLFVISAFIWGESLSLIVFPINYEYNKESGVAITSFEFSETSGVNSFFTFSITKETDGFHVILIIDGVTAITSTFNITDAGFDTKLSLRRVILTDSSGESMSLLILNTIWTDIKLPNYPPKSSI